jgi:hypothetical protein
MHTAQGISHREHIGFVLVAIQKTISFVQHLLQSGARDSGVLTEVVGVQGKTLLLQ